MTNTGLNPTRTQWCQVLLSEIDESYYLNKSEQAQTFAFLHQLLTALKIPERYPAQTLPARLVMELISPGSTRDYLRQPPSDKHGFYLPATTWARHFLTILKVSYPNLSSDEIALVEKMFIDYFAALGTSTRPASRTPTP